MNTDTLARHYDHLSCRERFALIVAARVRGDAVEAERLVRSAPTHAFTVADYRGLAEVMGELSWLHLARLLDAAARMWQAEGLLEATSIGAPKAASLDHSTRLLRVVQLWAYRFVLEWQAWERFCGELHLQGDALLRDLPGYPTVKEADSSARQWAFTPEEAAEAARLKFGDAAQVPTVDAVVADYRAGLAARENWWTP